MVLTRRAATVAGLLLSAVAGGTALAQDMPASTSVLDAPPALFVPTPIRVAGSSLEIAMNVRTEYDSNIYSQAFDTVDDVKFLFRPNLLLNATDGNLQFTGRADGDFRKFVNHPREDANGGRVESAVQWTPSATQTVSLVSGWQHVIEDRGEPEGQTNRLRGPRQLDMLQSELAWSQQGPRIGLGLRGSMASYRYIDDEDRNRNLNSFALVGRVGHRVSPLVNAFVEGFGTRRVFTAQTLVRDVNRDSNTYGSRVGIAIDPGGTLRGEAAVGVYHFDPDDGRLRPRTGISAQASLTFIPTPRIAFTLDGFTGNVATYRAGAQSRDDTRVRLGVQQEVRHNIRWQASALYRRSRYYGTGITENIYGGTFEVEYAFNRRIALAAGTRYAKRDSSVPLGDYSRWRSGLELKVHY